MRPVHVAILHPAAASDAGPLTRLTAAARARNAERHRAGFLAAGAATADVVSGAPDARPFGRRLRDLLPQAGDGGLVVLGSGAIPLAHGADRRELVEIAGADAPRALANNRYSADVIAVARASEVLLGSSELTTDNALPRWLAEVAGVPVEDRRGRTRLGIDIDGPLDLVLLGGRWAALADGIDTAAVRAALARVRAAVGDPRAELVIAGRVSAANLAWLEARTASRTRALVEERGLRTSRLGQRAPASVLGSMLERDGPSSLGRRLARLGDAAIVDTRVLLAHRLGANEVDWPSPEDRYASDLLRPEGIRDAWLAELTASALDAPVPVLLGGHTLVGPGLRLALASRARSRD
jgi:hypothetical protein